MESLNMYDIDPEGVALLAQLNGADEYKYAVEEMSELTKELMKRERGEDNVDSIIEECTDVLITVQSVLKYYNASPEQVKEIAAYKIDRALNSLGYFRECSKVGD